MKTGRKPKNLRIDWSKQVRFEVPIPKDEKQRLAALERYDILDTPPEESFESITTLASHVCHAPIAMMVLVDRERQWFKSVIGLDFTETPREHAFCAHTIMRRELFIISDATRDIRFARNPMVLSGPKIRFYAGAPLVTPDNRAIGTLCVMDSVRRTLTPEQKTDLVALSKLAMMQLELRRRLREEKGERSGRSYA
jgi:GAF domain-containing protein